MGESVIRSMTGFARVRRETGDGELVVSVKSLNHRGLDLHFHIPPALDPYENAMRSLLKRKLARGHIEIRIAVGKSRNGSELVVNEALMDAYLKSFRAMAAQYGIAAEADLNAALRLPGMFVEPADEDAPAQMEPLVLGALEEALDGLAAFRHREGTELAAVMRRHNASIHSAALQMEKIRGQALPAFQARLNERLREMLNGLSLDPQRLTQEAAILADRSDIGEEIARLKIHSSQLDQILNAGGEVGKKLDFLLQEMNRETNTILSKTSGIGEVGLRITELALGAKSDIEKVREQVLNLE